MTKEYLTIKEASHISGKSEITIRRLVKKLKKPDIKNQKIATGFKYLISKDYLTNYLTTQTTNQASTQGTTQEGVKATAKGKNTATQETTQTTNQETTQLITQLTTLTEFLKEQLREKDRQIAEVNNRLKESNIINMSLQKRAQIEDRKPNIFTRLFSRQKEQDK